MTIHTSTSNWVVRFRPKPTAKHRLICFPFAGGSAHAFREWADLLPEEIDLCVVQYPGRGRRVSEPLLDTHRAIVSRLVDSEIGLFLDRGTNVTLFGHSMGALLAFELTRTLRQRGFPMPQHLLVSAHHAPQLPGSRADRPVAEMDDATFTAFLRDMNGTEPEVMDNVQLMEMMLPVLRNDFNLCDAYQFKSERPLAVPITAFAGEQDAEADVESVQAWSEQTSSNFALHRFDGDHFFIHAFRPKLLQLISTIMLTCTLCILLIGCGSTAPTPTATAPTPTEQPAPTATPSPTDQPQADLALQGVPAQAVGNDLGVGCDGYADWETSLYVLPYPPGETYRVELSNCSSSFHRAGSVDEYAIDFNMPVGTLITASRAGVVMDVVEEGIDGDFPNNWVLVDHGDGTVLGYMHLTENGAIPEVGDRVEIGDPIGYSGVTGFAGYPHLHLTLFMKDQEYQSIPITFRNTEPNPRSLQSYTDYTAYEYESE